jgi:N-acetylneuraminate synthase
MRQHNKAEIIAEAGVNHNGSLERALEMVDVAARAGVDVVKFQTFKASALVTAQAKKAAYQERNVGAEGGQLEMLQRLELDAAAHHALIARCAERGVEFLSTPFDLASLVFLTRELGLKRIKLSSGDLTNSPFLVEVAREGVDVIMSTGMATLADVEEALGALAFGFVGEGEPGRGALREAYMSDAGQAALREHVVILHCTSEYPTPLQDVNLRVLGTLEQAFGLPVGLSDHTEGILAAVGAVARGAVMLEKHYTLDRSLPGPDHTSSLEPAELARLVCAVREVEQALGGPLKRVTTSELPTVAAARKSLVALVPIEAGELLTPQNLGIKRPGTGISPVRYWEFLGRSARRGYAAGELIED